MRRARKRLLVLGLTTVLAALLVEAGTRWMLFGDHPAFERQRDPGKYADYFSEDDYWLLDRVLGAGFTWPSQPHPVLGWTGPFDPETYVHLDAAEVGERRPVLLFGDSFSMCVGEVECFEDILNADPEFAAGHHLLNYGVHGYGVDQIWQLLEHSVDRFLGDGRPAPFVVVGLLTLDLDRSILSVRTGQKPRFALRDGELVRVGEPIAEDPEAWLAEHPPRIVSYAWRRLLRSPLVPESLGARLRGDAAFEAEKRELNAAILDAIHAALERRGLEHVFLVFHPNSGLPPGEQPDTWRDEFLRGWLESRGVEYVWSRAVIARDAPDATPADLFNSQDSHPTTLYNELIAAEIRRLVLR